MVTRAKAKKTQSLSVDFSDTEASGIPDEGDYVLEVTDVEQKTSDNSGNEYLSFTFAIADGEFKGKKVYHNCSLQPQALFNLRGVLESLGYEVPQGPMDLEIADLIGDTCGGSVSHEKYEGKLKARIVEFFKVEDMEAEPEEAPSPVTTKVTKASKKAAPEPEAEPEEAPKSKKKVKKAAVLEVGAAVSFTDDDGEVQSGKVTAMEDGNVTVLVGKDEWELDEADITLA